MFLCLDIHTNEKAHEHKTRRKNSALALPIPIIDSHAIDAIGKTGYGSSFGDGRTEMNAAERIHIVEFRESSRL